MRPECDLSGNICAIIGSIFQCWSCGSVHVDASWAVIPMSCDLFQGELHAASAMSNVLGKIMFGGIIAFGNDANWRLQGFDELCVPLRQKMSKTTMVLHPARRFWRVITAIQKVAGARFI